MAFPSIWRGLIVCLTTKPTKCIEYKLQLYQPDTLCNLRWFRFLPSIKWGFWGPWGFLKRKLFYFH
jgi:hypothetical protein